MKAKKLRKWKLLLMIETLPKEIKVKTSTVQCECIKSEKEWNLSL